MKQRIHFACNLRDIEVKSLQTEGYISQLKKLVAHTKKTHTVFVNQFEKLLPGDIVHIHDSGFYSAYKFRKIPNKKVYTVHSALEPKRFKMVRDVLMNPRIFKLSDKTYGSVFRQLFNYSIVIISSFIPLIVKKHFLKNPDVIVLPTQEAYDKINLKNSVVIRQSIDTAKFRKMKGANKEVSVGYFGHLAIAKGILELLKAFSKVPYTKTLYLTSKTKRFSDLVKKTDKRIIVKGFIKNIVQEYNNNDIIVAPYRHSGGAIATPLVVLEAMACERAVITTDLPHLREICGDTVLYVKPNAPDEIVKAIKKLAKNKKLRETLGKRARARVVKYYDQKDMFKAYDKLYSSLQ